MPTLQKFKLFATQCAAVNVPTKSPTTSPLIHLRRRKTLRMLLTRRPQISHPEPITTTTSLRKRSKLKDLFFSASSSSPTTHADVDDHQNKSGRGIRPGPQNGPRLVRPLVQPFGFRNRLILRKAWRPVLSTIEEIQD